MTKFSAPQQSQLAQIGAFLRENREKQEKSLEDIAIRTYIRPQLLNGIEKGDPDLLPEPIFVQGFIRRYAEALGLKGTELAQQFTVTSIPSTPRPARQSAPADSASTRISRAMPDQLPSPQNSATTPILSQASAPLPNDPFLNGGQNRPVSSPSPAADPAPEIASTEGAAAASSDRPAPMTAPEVPLIREAPPAQHEDLPAASPIVTNGVTNGRQAALSSEASSADSRLETERLGNGNLLERIDNQPGNQQPASNGAPAAALETSTEQHSALSTPAADTVAVDKGKTTDTFEKARSNGTPGYQPGPENADVDADSGHDDLPITPTAGLTAEAAPVLPVGPPATNTGPVGIEPVGIEPSGTGYERSSAPNLKPFIIGGVVAALTAGVVILVSLIGNRDRQPEVTGSVDTTSQAADSAPNAATVGDPVEAAKPPVSTAPVYVEATATDQAWVSVIADGSTIFEGTLQPGDTQLWEAQETLDIFAGNAGGLELAPNGEVATVMGSNGQQGEKIFTPE